MSSTTEAPVAQEPGLPTLHHLNNSQSQRIIWLLEELNIKYNLVKYLRTPQQAAPPEMAKIHPLGKAPILVTAEGNAIPETSAIVTYLLQTYDPAGKFATDDVIREEVFSSYAGSSLGTVSIATLLFEMVPKMSPWPLSTLLNVVANNFKKMFTTTQYASGCKWLDSELGDAQWFNGKHLGKSDVMLTFPFDVADQRGWVDFEKEWPRLVAWRKRIVERDAWKRGMEKGNGYVLTFEE